MKIIKKLMAVILTVFCLLTLVSINTQNVKAAVDHCTINFVQGSDAFTITCPQNSFSVDNSTRFQISFNNNNGNYYVNFEPTISYSDDNIILSVSNDWSRYSGSWVPKGTYKLKLHINGDSNVKILNNNADIDYPGINIPYPRSIKISINERKDLVVSCDGSIDTEEVCCTYLNTLYDTQNDSNFNNGKTNSNIMGFTQGAGGPPLMIPVQSPVPSVDSEQYHLFEFDSNNNLVVTNKKLAKYTTATSQTYETIKLHVIGYGDYYQDKLAIKILKLAVDENTLGLDIAWDNEQNNFIVRSSSQEYLSSLTNCTIDQLSSEKIVTFNVNPTTNQDDKGYYVVLNSYGQLGRLDSGEIEVNIKLSSNLYNDYSINTSFINSYQVVESMSITPVASGFRIKSSNTSFIDMINNRDERFMLNITGSIDNTTGRPYDNYRITLDKFGVSKVNDNEIIILASQEQLEALANTGAQPTEDMINLDKEEGYVFQVYHPLFATTNNNLGYKLNSIVLGSKISELDGTVLDVNDLKKLEEMLINLTNIQVSNNLSNEGTVVTNVNGVLAGTLCNNYEEGNGNSDLNKVGASITVNTKIIEVSENDADKIAEKVDGEAVGSSFDVSITRKYDGSNEENVNELAYDAIIEFEIADDIELADDEELVVVREHTNNDQSVSYDVLEVSVDEDGVGSVASDKFSRFVLVKRKKVVDTPANNPIINNSTNTYDDGGPFTSDVCGNIYDRWGNKLYSAPSCVLNDGYVVPNTGVK